ncbi:MAG TPA: class I SAM-dependent methyltransferase [Solirubrobacteraceae bacterium]
MAESEYHERLWESIPEGLEPQWWRARATFLLERVYRGERVLDVGCGEGRFAAELAAAGAEVLGLDVAAEPLRRARARYPDLDLRQLDACGRWPLEDASFDVVWAGEVIEHLYDTAGWLSEARRVLRSGGRLLLSTPAHPRLLRLALAFSPRAFETHFDPRGEHLRFYTARTLTGLLEDFGFAQVEVSSAGPLRAGRPLLLCSAQRKRF